MNARARSGWWAGWLLMAATAHAGCSRPLQAPMAPAGLSVLFDGERAGGLYPALLREVGATLDCEFLIPRVPRARAQKLFESGQADLLTPASASLARDADGEFVPLIQVRASLVTLSRAKQVPHTLAALLAQRGFKLAVVRGFTFGPAYDRAIAALRAQHRLVEEPDPAGVARALRQGLAEGAIMSANILLGTLAHEPDLAPLVSQARVQALDELQWAESGLYLSRHTLSEDERRMLRAALTQAAKSGRVWRLFNDIYPPNTLTGSIRPLP